MPIQVFCCQQCSHRFERMLPVGAQASASCPVCGKSGVWTPACVAYPKVKRGKKQNIVRMKAAVLAR